MSPRAGQASERAQLVRQEAGKVAGDMERFERYVSTLLGFLESVHARGVSSGTGLSDTAIAVCRGIARETGSASFPEPKPKEKP
jgi:hypothetical protein